MANCQQEVQEWRAEAEKGQKEIVDLKRAIQKHSKKPQKLVMNWDYLKAEEWEARCTEAIDTPFFTPFLNLKSNML